MGFGFWFFFFFFFWGGGGGGFTGKVYSLEGGLGLGAGGLGLGAWGLGLGAWGLGLGARGLGFGAWGLGDIPKALAYRNLVRANGLGFENFRVELGLRFLGFRYRVFG